MPYAVTAGCFAAVRGCGWFVCWFRCFGGAASLAFGFTAWALAAAECRNTGRLVKSSFIIGQLINDKSRHLLMRPNSSRHRR